MSEPHERPIVDVLDNPNMVGNCQICGIDGPTRKTASYITPFWLCLEHEQEYIAWIIRQMKGKYLWEIWPSMPENPKNRKRGGRG